MSDTIVNFKVVSGLEMHHDPSRNKCQALPFGHHKVYTDWPEWVSVQNKVKIVRAMFINEGNLEKINSDLVSKCFFVKLNQSYGIKGTILQKVYFVNTFLFSKVFSWPSVLILIGRC